MEMNFEKLIAYKKAYKLAMDVFMISKGFPSEEKYSLTDQVRRSTRSVCSNIAEAYRKRRYEAHFISKLSDADMENSESAVWINFSFDCGYIDINTKETLLKENIEIGKLIAYMINNPAKFTADVTTLREVLPEYNF